MAPNKGSVPWNKGKRGVMPNLWNKGLSINDEKISEIVEKSRESIIRGYRNGRRPWNYGLTKTDTRVFLSGKRQSETKKSKFADGILTTWNKGKSNSQIPWNKGKVGVQASPRKGLNKNNSETVRIIAMKITGDWDKLYGKERYDERKRKIKEARLRQIFPKSTCIEDTTKMILQELGFREKKSIMSCTEERDFVSQISIDGICQPDFMFPNKKIIVECDGDYWHGNPLVFQKLDKTQTFVRNKDQRQQLLLENNGWKVHRFWENLIKNEREKYKIMLSSVLV